MKSTVYVVDDHAVVREGVRWLLEGTGEFEIVGEAETAETALAGIISTQPDIATIDVRLGHDDGVELLREVMSRGAQTRCLLLTSFPDETTFYQAVLAGAMGYLIKDCPPEQLIEACRAVASGRSLMSREAIDELRQRATGLPEGAHLLAQLTPQERRILELITHGHTNREIAADMSLAEKTVRNYVSNLLSKMHMRNRTEAAAYVARSAARRHERALSAASHR